MPCSCARTIRGPTRSSAQLYWMLCGRPAALSRPRASRGGRVLASCLRSGRAAHRGPRGAPRGWHRRCSTALALARAKLGPSRRSEPISSRPIRRTFDVRQHGPVVVRREKLRLPDRTVRSTASLERIAEHLRPDGLLAIDFLGIGAPSGMRDDLCSRIHPARLHALTRRASVVSTDLECQVRADSLGL